MNDLIQKIRTRLTAMWQSLKNFYRANRLLILSSVTVLSIVLIVWARLGFTLQFSKFFASGVTQCEQNGGTCRSSCQSGENQLPNTLGCESSGEQCCVAKAACTGKYGDIACSVSVQVSGSTATFTYTVDGRSIASITQCS